MRRIIGTIMAALVLVFIARTAMAQSKTLTGESRTVTATIEAIEASTHTLTLKKPDGTYVSVIAGPEIKRFDELKIGDKVNARYYDNLVIRLKKPGEKDVDTAARATTPSGQALPGGTNHHGDDHRDRSRDAVGHVHGPERLEVLVEGRGQGGARQGQGRRQGRYHLDRGGAVVGRTRHHVVVAVASARPCVLSRQQLPPAAR